MRLIVATIGLSLISFAAGWAFLGLWHGVQITVGLVGVGLTFDALRPNRVEHKELT